MCNNKQIIIGGDWLNPDLQGCIPLTYTNIFFLCFKLCIILIIIETVIILLSKSTIYCINNLFDTKLNFNINSWIDFKPLFYILILVYLINIFFIKNTHSFYIVLYTIIIIISKNIIKYIIYLFSNSIDKIYWTT